MRSPFEVPIPTHSEVSPTDPVGAFGSTSVELASRIQEPAPTGPVLKAGPNAAFTEQVSAAVARNETSWREDGILVD
jgi:hypothetical protein